MSSTRIPIAGILAASILSALVESAKRDNAGESPATPAQRNGACSACSGATFGCDLASKPDKTVMVAHALDISPDLADRAGITRPDFVSDSVAGGARITLAAAHTHLSQWAQDLNAPQHAIKTALAAIDCAFAALDLPPPQQQI